MRISYSALETYKNCPLKFKYQQLDKIKAPKNVEMVFGSAVHGALKFMFEKNPLFPTIDEVIDFFGKNFEQKMSAFQDEESRKKKKIYYEEGVSMIKNFYKKNQPWNFNTVDLESRFETELVDEDTGERHILTGIIDRIDKDIENDEYEIIDYKTNKKMPGQHLVDNDLQLSIYQLGVLRRWPHLSPSKIKLSLYFLKHGEKISTVRSEEDIKNTQNEILRNINEIQERIKNNYDFPPTPSVLCDWCGYKEICPMWKHLYKSQLAPAPNEEEMREIVREYFNLKEQNQRNNERINELKMAIMRFMDEQKVERVFGEDGYITRNFQEKYSYDLEKAREILEPIGKWQEVLSVDEKKLGQILSSLPKDIQEKILSLRTARKIPSLKISRKNSIDEDSLVE